MSREKRISKLKAMGWRRVDRKRMECPHCGAVRCWNMIRREHLTGRCKDG